MMLTNSAFSSSSIAKISAVASKIWIIVAVSRIWISIVNLGGIIVEIESAWVGSA